MSEQVNEADDIKKDVKNAIEEIEVRKTEPETKPKTSGGCCG
ncbi:MAG: hypothetical protein ACW968_11800 [Candidatus Thorarchaeota archaeon]|jgi:hypothetical protein